MDKVLKIVNTHQSDTWGVVWDEMEPLVIFYKIFMMQIKLVIF